MNKRMLESNSRMRFLLGNNPLGEFIKIVRDICIGFKMAERNRGNGKL
jgi:hypothetical protein